MKVDNRVVECYTSTRIHPLNSLDLFAYQIGILKHSSRLKLVYNHNLAKISLSSFVAQIILIRSMATYIRIEILVCWLSKFFRIRCFMKAIHLFVCLILHFYNTFA